MRTKRDQNPVAISGATLLLFGVAVLVGSSAVISRWRRRLERPLPPKSKRDEAVASDDVDEHLMEVDPPPAGAKFDPRPYCGPVNQVMPGTLGGGGDAEGCLPPQDVEPRAVDDVAMATGSPTRFPVVKGSRRRNELSYWTTADTFRGQWGRHFGASRTNEETGRKQYHVGIDLFGNEGDMVVASEPGEVIAILPFYHGTWAVYQKTNDGKILVYGEIKKGSWSSYGLKVGDKLQAGDPVARVGRMHNSAMLHFETYRAWDDTQAQVEAIRKGRFRWFDDEPRNPDILNPSKYVLKALRAEDAAGV